MANHSTGQIPDYQALYRPPTVNPRHRAMVPDAALPSPFFPFSPVPYSTLSPVSASAHVARLTDGDRA